MIISILAIAFGITAIAINILTLLHVWEKLVRKLKKA